MNLGTDCKEILSGFAVRSNGAIHAAYVKNSHESCGEMLFGW